MEFEKVVLTDQQAQGQPVWHTDESRECPLCPVCKSGWCDLNTGNYLECPECHVQYKDVTRAGAGMSPLAALENTGGVTLLENATYTNDDGSGYEGIVYESCGYRLIPRLDVIVNEPAPGMPAFITQRRHRDKDDPKRKEFLLGNGDFR